MQFAEKMQKLRKERGMSQENLAEIIGVSRQSVSKWESGQSYPEMDKMIALSELFNVSIDELVKDTSGSTGSAQNIHNSYVINVGSQFHYEYKSKRTLLGIPLVHVNVGRGIYVAKGIIAIGNISIGVLSFGILAFGFISLGALAAGLLMALGGLAMGTIAMGGLALGIFVIGGLAIGMFTLGGCAIASHIAIGGYATGHIAIGESAAGAHTLIMQHNELNSIDGDQVRSLINQEYPNLWKTLVDGIVSIFNSTSWNP